MASLVGRLLVLLIPIVAVLYPLMRFLAALYGWLMRRKIARLYGELRLLGVLQQHARPKKVGRIFGPRRCYFN